MDRACTTRDGENSDNNGEISVWEEGNLDPPYNSTQKQKKKKRELTGK